MCSTRYGSSPKIVPAITAGQNVRDAGRDRSLSGPAASPLGRLPPSPVGSGAPRSEASLPSLPATRSRTSRYMPSAESQGPSSRMTLETGRIGAPAASAGSATRPCSRTASENARTRCAG